MCLTHVAIAEWVSCRHEFVSRAIKFSHQVRVAVVPCVTCPSFASSFYPFLRVHADVAVSLTSMAVIVHRARRRGSPEGVGSQLRAVSIAL